MEEQTAKLCYDVVQTVLTHTFKYAGRSISQNYADIIIDNTSRRITAGLWYDVPNVSDSLSIKITNLEPTNCEGNLNGAIEVTIRTGSDGSKTNSTMMWIIIGIIIIAILAWMVMKK